MMEQKSRILKLGDNLKRLRLKHGYSQEGLCAVLEQASCNILRSTYSKYEYGELNVKISILITLKKIYNCSYDEFFAGLERAEDTPIPSGLEQKLRRDLKMGENLKKLRLKHGYSQENLCAKLQQSSCDIGRSTYSKYEHGELNIRVDILVTLKEIYGCEFEDFFSGLKCDIYSS